MLTQERDLIRVWAAALLLAGLGAMVAALSLELWRPTFIAIAARAGLAGFGELADLLGLHLGVFAAAIILACAALLAMTRGPADEGHLGRAVMWSGCLFVALYWASVGIWSHTAIIDGVRFWWLSDDQMIAMRYARNLAEGHGLVWNPGERVEGFSNPLWTLYMALLHRVVPLSADTLSAVVLATNLVLAAATVPLVMGLARSLGGPPSAQFVAVALYGVCAHALYLAITGWEQTLLLALTLAALLMTFADLRARRARIATCLLLGVIALVRVDAALVSGTLGLALLFYSVRRRETFIRLAACAMIPATYLAFRIVYYGEFVPNTYFLKVVGWNRIRFGTDAIISFGREYFVPLCAAALGWRFTGQRREYALCLVLIAVHAAYMGWTGGGFGSDSRKYVLPVLPVLFVLGSVTAMTLAARAPRPSLAATLAAALLFIGPRAAVPGKDTRYLERMRSGELRNVIIGKALRAVGPDALVVDAGAGQVYYFGGTRGHDYLGINDKYIARRDPAVQIAFAGHSKYDFDYSIGKIRPDYVVAALPADTALTGEVIERWATGNWPFVGELYRHEPFLKYCLPHPMPWQTPRIVYQCIWPDAGTAA